MRDNGLTASAYTSMGGIDPLVADPVLAALAEAGIAAYCAPPGEPDPSSEPTAGRPAETTPDPTNEAAPDAEAEGPAKAEAPAKADEPVQRIPVGFEEIFVDSGSVEAAREVIDRSTEDAEWQSLVEQYNAPSAPGHDAPPVPRWPASEDVDETYEPLIDVPAGLIVGDTDEEPPDEPPPARRKTTRTTTSYRRNQPADLASTGSVAPPGSGCSAARWCSSWPRCSTSAPAGSSCSAWSRSSPASSPW